MHVNSFIMHKNLCVIFFIAGCFGQSNDKIVKNDIKGDILNKDIPTKNYYGDEWYRSGYAGGYFDGEFPNSPIIEKEKLEDGLIRKDGRGDDKIGIRRPFDGYELRRKYEIDAGNPDIHGRIERPCEVYDLVCIRRFFAEHSKCRKVKGPVPEPLYRNQANLYITRANVSATLINVEYKGINNARVEEFYINKATDNLIITLGFEAITLFSNNTYIRYFMNRREPVTTRDFAGAFFPKLSITAIIPKINDLQLEKAEITTFANTIIPPFIAGPRLALDTDLAVPLMFGGLLANVPTDYQEVLLTEGPFYAATHIQYNICDFGLKVV